MDHPFSRSDKSDQPIAAPYSAQYSAPFILEHRRLDQTPSGDFRPHARLILSPTLRTSGFWHSVPPDEFKTLLLMLTFLTPNGWCRPTLPELSEAMRIPEAKARVRMQRLGQAHWHGQPIIRLLPLESGGEVWTPAPQLADVQESPPTPSALETLPRPASSESVIAWSRAQYAHPRAEVEREIAQRMGWEPPAFDKDDPEVAEGKRQAYGQLTSLGFSKEQALDALSRFDLTRIARQIEWLPYRQAKSPARFLLAAIEGDYEPPLSLRRQAVREEAHNEEEQEDPALEGHAFSQPPPAEQLPFGQGTADLVPGGDPTLPDNSLALPETDLALPDASTAASEARFQPDALPQSASQKGDGPATPPGS